MKTIVLSLLVLLGSNMAIAKKHESEALPWHFHTGKGVLKSASFDPDSGMAVDRFTGECELSEFDPNCYERVFFFSRHEILHFVNTAKELLLSKRDGHAWGAAFAGTIAVTATRGAVLASGTPATIALGVGAGIAAVVVYFEGRAIHRINKQLEAIDTALKEEDDFVFKCGHVHKDFLSKMADLGVHIEFNEWGGKAIPSSFYLSGVEHEKKLYDQTISIAKDRGWSRQEAYSNYFHDQCGQLPAATLTPGEEFFQSDWDFIPEDTLVRAARLGERMALSNQGHSIEFSGFEDDDANEKSERAGLKNFLDETEHLVYVIEGRRPWVLTDFANEFEKIIIKPRFKLVRNKSYEVYEHDSKKYLILYANWSLVSKKYRLSLIPYLEDRYGLEL